MDAEIRTSRGSGRLNAARAGRGRLDPGPLARRVLALLQGPPESGPTTIPRLGIVFCVRSHKLHSISMPRSAAVAVLAGRKTLRLSDQPEGPALTVGRGEMFLYPAGVPITVENEPDPDGGRYLALCLPFDEALVARTSADAAPEHARPFALEDLRVDCDAAVQASLAHLLEMALAAPDDERLPELCAESLLRVLAARTRALPLLWSASASWSARCGSLVAVDPGREWSAGEVARRLGASERTLRRHLRAEGTGLRAILQDVRLNAGLGLLQAGAGSVGEVAWRCGYSSASRFAGLFRRRFGVSPSEVLACNA